MNRPAIATGSVALVVSRDIYKLNILVDTKEANKTYTPSSTIQIDVDVTQYTDKKPVDKVEVCLIVVDESILSLTDYKLTSPLDLFYPDRSANIQQYHGRNRCLLFSMQNIEEFKKALREKKAQFTEGGVESLRCMSKRCCCCCSASAACGNGGHSELEQTISVRSNFNPLACWAPSSTTNSSGHVSFEFKLPDNLTRYRVWAVAANEKQYGLGEMLFTVQLPVMIRPSPPRFFNYGDTAHLSVILQNQTDQSFVLHTGLKVTNQQLAGYAVQLEVNKRVAVIFPLSTI